MRNSIRNFDCNAYDAWAAVCVRDEISVGVSCEFHGGTISSVSVAVYKVHKGSGVEGEFVPTLRFDATNNYHGPIDVSDCDKLVFRLVAENGSALLADIAVVGEG